MAYWHQSVLSITKVHKTTLKCGGTSIRLKLTSQSNGVSDFTRAPSFSQETWDRRWCGDMSLIQYILEQNDMPEPCRDCVRPVKIAIVGHLVSKRAVSKQVLSVKSWCRQLPSSCPLLEWVPWDLLVHGLSLASHFNLQNFVPQVHGYNWANGTRLPLLTS